IILHSELADLALQLGDPAGVVYRRQSRTPAPDSGKRQISLGSPLPAPALQQMRTHLIFARNLAGRGAGVQGAHGSDLQIATVNSSGQIHSSLHSMYLFLNLLSLFW